LEIKNVVRLVDYFKTDGMMCIVMEKVEGEDLFEMIMKDRLSGTKIKDITKQLAEILAEMHENGISHGDIKPENIMVDNRGRVTLVDMGFVGKMEEDAANFLGTPWYMCPEQTKGAHSRGPVDMFAVGVTIYAMVFQEAAFSSRTIRGHELQPRFYHSRFQICPDWTNVSIECRMILTSLMHECPSLRMTARELAECDWVNQKASVDVSSVGVQTENYGASEVEQKKFFSSVKIRKFFKWMIVAWNRFVKNKV
jgi:serine/threonine protein kinase